MPVNGRLSAACEKKPHRECTPYEATPPINRVMHHVWEYCHAQLAFTMAVFNGLAQWHGFQPPTSGCMPFLMAAFGV
jgi:hypothetical protein